MTILQIAVLVAVAIILGRLSKARQLAMLAVSTMVIFWLQPLEPFVSLQYWLPIATLILVGLSWALTSGVEVRGWRQNWAACLVIIVAAVAGQLIKFYGPSFDFRLPVYSVFVLLLAVISMFLFVLRILQWKRANQFGLGASLAAIVIVFIILKAPALSDGLIQLLARSGSVHLAITTPLSWLGFSYAAFRLLHTIRDRQTGRLPSVTLGEYVNYVIFFPAFTAGPIDRLERFLKDLCNPLQLNDADWVEAGSRVFVGLFKKFVVADLLAVISINDVLVQRVHSSGWLWFFLYAYALRIYFDFSGYTDIAIGMARLMGIRLPENFTAPYLKPNLTQFWNSWHITLTQWFRSYFFNPVTRAMRSSARPIPGWLVILIGQLATMVLIGLWHGVTGGFVLWGAWHGIGLFIHNRWSAWIRPRAPQWLQSRAGGAVSSALGLAITFNFVAVGWLFFGLSTPGIAWMAMRKLMGVGL